MRSQRQSVPTMSESGSETVTRFAAAFSAIAVARQLVDFGCFNRGRASQGAGDGGDAAAGSEVEHAATGDDRGIVQHMAGQCLATRPCEGPERRFQIAFGEPGLGRLPDRRDLAGEMQRDLGNQRRISEQRLIMHESNGIAHRITAGVCARMQPCMLRYDDGFRCALPILQGASGHIVPRRMG